MTCLQDTLWQENVIVALCFVTDGCVTHICKFKEKFCTNKGFAEPQLSLSGAHDVVHVGKLIGNKIGILLDL